MSSQYDIKKMEEGECVPYVDEKQLKGLSLVVYDISLRGLVPSAAADATQPSSHKRMRDTAQL